MAEAGVHRTAGSEGETEVNEAKFPATFTRTWDRAHVLRYGENPHQQASLYLDPLNQNGFAHAEQLGGKTQIIVAQRISTVLHADQIVVLDEGRVVGRGTHAELMDACESYREIALSQLSEEELEEGDAQ